jgi:hypothetical protein
MGWKRAIAGSFLALLCTLVLPVQAAELSPGKDFEHATTGFRLEGGHATAACETCHANGVFKGTPRNCDGCHAVGKRVVATPKSSSHIVTDAPCETCHFNAATWLGARYNHATARPGQCLTCHNGRVAKGKHSAHVATTESCDQCHRTQTWSPASWNHTGAAYSGQDCAACHRAAGPGRNYTSTRHGTYSSLAILTPCASCHTSYYSFTVHQYRHDKPFVSCGDCHANATYANGVTQAADPIHVSATAVGITNCESCHVRSFVSWAGARYKHNDAAFASGDCRTCHDGTHAGITGIPSNHGVALATLINPPAQCNWCHTATSSWAGMNHAQIKAGTQCKACHLTGTSNFSGMIQKRIGHEGMTATQDCVSCHQTRYDLWNEP